MLERPKRRVGGIDEFMIQRTARQILKEMETYAEVQKNYALQRMRAKTTSEIRKKHMQNLWHSGRIPGRRRRM